MLKKVGFIIAGLVFFILGCIGLILPVIPQVPFFILALSFFAKASGRFRNRLEKSRIYQWVIGIIKKYTGKETEEG